MHAPTRERIRLELDRRARSQSSALRNGGLAVSLPRLQGYFLKYEDSVGAVVRNSGGGTAEGVHVMDVIGGHGFVAVIGDGFLRPGEGARIVSPIVSAEPKGFVVMFGRDSDLVLRSWSSDGRRKVYRSRILRRRTYPDNNVIFNDLFPDIDLHQITEHPTQLLPIQDLAGGGASE